MNDRISPRDWHEAFIVESYTQWASRSGLSLIWWRDEDGILGCAPDDKDGYLHMRLWQIARQSAGKSPLEVLDLLR